jgi:hypothetical protein
MQFWLAIRFIDDDSSLRRRAMLTRSSSLSSPLRNQVFLDIRNGGKCA